MADKENGGVSSANLFPFIADSSLHVGSDDESLPDELPTFGLFQTGIVNDPLTSPSGASYSSVVQSHSPVNASGDLLLLDQLVADIASERQQFNNLTLINEEPSNFKFDAAEPPHAVDKEPSTTADPVAQTDSLIFGANMPAVNEEKATEDSFFSVADADPVVAEAAPEQASTVVAADESILPSYPVNDKIVSDWLLARVKQEEAELRVFFEQELERQSKEHEAALLQATSQARATYDQQLETLEKRLTSDLEDRLGQAIAKEKSGHVRVLDERSQELAEMKAELFEILEELDEVQEDRDNQKEFVSELQFKLVEVAAERDAVESELFEILEELDEVQESKTEEVARLERCVLELEQKAQSASEKADDGELAALQSELVELRNKHAEELKELEERLLVEKVDIFQQTKQAMDVEKERVVQAKEEASEEREREWTARLDAQRESDLAAAVNVFRATQAHTKQPEKAVATTQTEDFAVRVVPIKASDAEDLRDSRRLDGATNIPWTQSPTSAFEPIGEPSKVEAHGVVSETVEPEKVEPVADVKSPETRKPSVPNVEAKVPKTIPSASKRQAESKEESGLSRRKQSLKPAVPRFSASTRTPKKRQDDVRPKSKLPAKSVTSSASKIGTRGATPGFLASTRSSASKKPTAIAKPSGHVRAKGIPKTTVAVPKTKSRLQRYNRNAGTQRDGIAGRRSSIAPPSSRSGRASMLPTPSKGGSTASALKDRRGGPRLSVSAVSRSHASGSAKKLPSPKDLVRGVVSSFANESSLPDDLQTPAKAPPVETIDETPREASPRSVEKKFATLFDTWSTTRKRRASSALRTPPSLTPLTFDWTGPRQTVSRTSPDAPVTATPAVRTARVLLQTPAPSCPLTSDFSPEELLVSPVLKKEPLDSDSVHASAATGIQRIVRGTIARAQFGKDLISLVLVQSHARMRVCRELYRKSLLAVVAIQKMSRGWHVRSHVCRMNESATTLQCMYRRRAARHNYNQRMELVAQCTAAATTIQKNWRMRTCVIDLAAFRDSVILVQSLARVKFQRGVLSMYRTGAIRLQSAWRGHCIRHRIEQESQAVVQIQRIYRGGTQRRHFSIQLRSVRILQRSWKRTSIRRLRATTVRAVVNMQRVWRGANERRRIGDDRSAAATIQRVWRGHVGRDVLLARRMEQSATLIQSIVRGFAARQKQSREIAIGAATRIQARWRSSAVHGRFQSAKSGVVTLQRMFRALRVRRATRLSLEAAICVQRLCRGFLARNTCLKRGRAVRLIQAQWMGACARTRLRAFVSAAVLVQKMVRGHTVRLEFDRQQTAGATMQRVIRGGVARLRLTRERDAAAKLQASVQRMACQRQYNDARRSAIVLQSQFRRVLCRREASMMCLACKKIQATWRMQLLRSRYKAVVGAAVYLQSVRRMKTAVDARKSGQRAVSILQRSARSMIERRRYLCLRSSCVLVQRSIRGHLARKAFRAMPKKRVPKSKPKKPVEPAPVFEDEEDFGLVTGDSGSGFGKALQPSNKVSTKGRKPLGAVKPSENLFSPLKTRRGRKTTTKPKEPVKTKQVTVDKDLKPIADMKVVELKEELMGWGFTSKDLRQVRKAELAEMLRSQRVGS